MKRILLVAAAASVAANGCVNENHAPYDPVVPLAFEPVILAHTRTPDESSFGVSVWSQEDTDNAPTTIPSTADPLLSNAKLVRDGFLWYPENRSDWPDAQHSLLCLGYAPYGVGTCNATSGVCFDHVDTSDDPGDLRYTKPLSAASKNKNGGIITLPMIPALCEVNFRIRSSSGSANTEIFLIGIRLDNIALCGNFHSLPQPLWELAEERGSLDFFNGDLPIGDLPQEAGPARRVIPQELQGSLSVIYEYTTPNGMRIRQNINNISMRRTLLGARRHTFTLVISPSTVEVISEILPTNLSTE